MTYPQMLRGISLSEVEDERRHWSTRIANEPGIWVDQWKRLVAKCDHEIKRRKS